MATSRFYSKTILAAGSKERQTLKRSCIGYIAWQWDRYLVPQNVGLFLVFQMKTPISNKNGVS